MVVVEECEPFAGFVAHDEGNALGPFGGVRRQQRLRVRTDQLPISAPPPLQFYSNQKLLFICYNLLKCY
jgi:hypothetical protein